MTRSYLEILYPGAAGSINAGLDAGADEDAIAFDIERRRDAYIAAGHRPAEVDAALGMTARTIVEAQRYLDDNLAEAISGISKGDTTRPRVRDLLQTVRREGMPPGLIAFPKGRKLIEGLGEEATQGNHYFAREMSYEFQGREGVVDRLGPQKADLPKNFTPDHFDYSDSGAVTRMVGGFMRGVDTFIAGTVFNTQDWLFGNEQAGEAAKRIFADVEADRATDESMIGQVGELFGTSAMFMLAGALIGGAISGVGLAGGATALEAAAPIGYAGVGGGIVEAIAGSKTLGMFAKALTARGISMGATESFFEGGMAYRAVEDATGNRQQAQVAAASVFWQNLALNSVIDSVTWFGDSEFMKRAVAPLQNSKIGRFVLRWGATYGTEMTQETLQNVISEHEVAGTPYWDINWLETAEKAGIPMMFSTMLTRGAHDYLRYRSYTSAFRDKVRSEIEAIDMKAKLEAMKGKDGEAVQETPKEVSGTRQPVAETDADGDTIHYGWSSEADVVGAKPAMNQAEEDAHFQNRYDEYQRFWANETIDPVTNDEKTNRANDIKFAGAKARNTARDGFRATPDAVIADVMNDPRPEMNEKKDAIRKLRNDIKGWGKNKEIWWEQRNDIRGLHEDLQEDSRSKVGELIERHKIADELAAEGKRIWAEKVNARHQEQAVVIKSAADVAGKPSTAGEIWSSHQEVKDRDEKKGNILRRAVGAIIGVSRTADTMDGHGQLDEAGNRKVPNYQGPVHRMVIDPVVNAEARTQIKIREVKAYFDEVLKRFGVTKKGLSERVQIGDQTCCRADLMYYWYGARNPLQARRLIYDNDLGKVVGIQKGEHAADAAKRLVELADSILTDGEKNVAMHVGKVLDDLFPRVNAVSREYDNVDMGKQDFYLPEASSARDKSIALFLDFDPDTGALTTNAGEFFARTKTTQDFFTKDRTGNLGGPISTNMMEVMYRHIPSMIRYAEMRGALENAAGVVGNPVFRSAVERRTGKKGKESFDHFIREEANPGYMTAQGDVWDNIARWTRANATTMYLFGNMMTVMKQAPSVAQYFLFAPHEMLGSAVTKCMNENKMLPFDFAMANSDYMKLRAASPEQMIYGIDQKEEMALKGVLDVGMAGIRAVDMAVTTYGWTCCYYEARDHQGLSHEEAVTWADRITKNTQPDATKSENPAFYRREVGRTLLAFSNQLNKYFQTTAHDGFGSKKGMRIMSQLAIVGVTAYLIQAISEGAFPTKPEDIARGQAEMMVSLLPFGRETVAVTHGYGGEGLLTKIPKEAGSLYTHSVKALTAWENGDENYIQDHWLEIFNSLAFFLRLPASGVRKATRYYHSNDIRDLIWTPKSGGQRDLSRFQ